MSGAGQIVRLKKGKQTFEVITNEGAVLKYRSGDTAWDQVLVTDTIYKNCGKGDQANEEDIRTAFDMSDMKEVLKNIIEKGELQVSAAERKEAMDKKKKEIIVYLHRNYIDPKSKLPHPIVRLEQALENSKYRVDADGQVVKQSQELIKALLGKLSFAKSEMEGVLSISHAYSGACANIVHAMAEVKKEDYTAEGVRWEVGVSPGDFDAFIAALNKSTKGDYDFKLAGAQEAAPAEEEKGKGKGKGKKKKGKK